MNNIYLNELGKGFKSAESRKSKLETARNLTRKMLTRENPGVFPTGDELTSLDDLANQLFGLKEWGTTTTKCTKCSATHSSVPSFSGSQTVVYDSELHSTYKKHYAVSHWMTAQKIRANSRKCSRCKKSLIQVTTLDEAPPMFYLSLSDNSMLFGQFLTLSQAQNRHRYVLRGVTYFANKHFTARLIKPDGNVWYHDGIETGSKTLHEGLLSEQGPRFLNSKLRDGAARESVGLLYCRVDI